MNLETRIEGNITVLTFSGRLDAFTASSIATAIEQAAAKTSAQVIVNLTQVTFIDSTGLAALVQGMKRCRDRRGDLRLCGLASPVRIIFELTRLDKAFEIFASEAQALASYTPASA